MDRGIMVFSLLLVPLMECHAQEWSPGSTDKRGMLGRLLEAKKPKGYQHGPYAIINNHMPVIRMYLEGHEMRSDYRVSRETFHGLLAILDLRRHHGVALAIRRNKSRVIFFPAIHQLEEVGRGFGQLALHEAFNNATKVISMPDSEGSPSHLSADDPESTPAAVTKDDIELPTCLMCVCLTRSVYCEEVDPPMTAVPPLPKETGYLYARYNSLEKITNKDFADFPTIKRIDLTGNQISEIEDGAFSKLVLLEQLLLADNRLVKLPSLPSSLIIFNANHNQLKTKGVKANAFKKMIHLQYLYLADNQLEAVPHLPESLRVVHLQNNNITAINDMTFCKGNTTRYLRTSMDMVRLDGNPVGLSIYPNSFICLRSLPVGRYF